MKEKILKLPSTIRPLRKETLQDGVFQRLCQLLLEGEIAPGQSVTVASLSNAFEVSAMPIREAISRLVNAGALTVVSGRTIGVPKITHERLEELRKVRREVEAVAVSWAVNNVSRSKINRLDTHLSRLKEVEACGDVVAYIGANYDFHFSIYSMAESPMLLGIIQNLWLQISPYFHLLRESGNFLMSNQCHERMVNAMKAGDEQGAVNALQADIDGACRVLKTIL